MKPLLTLSTLLATLFISTAVCANTADDYQAKIMTPIESAKAKEVEKLLDKSRVKCFFIPAQGFHKPSFKCLIPDNEAIGGYIIGFF